MTFTKKLLAIFLSLAILIGNFQNVGSVYAEASKLNLQQINELSIDTRGVSTLVLSWERVKNASGYNIYRLDTKTDKYVYRGSTTANTYKDKELTSATNYYYKVRPYKLVKGKKEYGSYSNRLKVTTKPLTPKLSVKKSSSGKMTATWTNTSSRATGYEIYTCNTRDGKYKLIDKISEKSYTFNNLDKSRSNYLKVRAFRTVDGENIYGSYSQVTLLNLDKIEDLNLETRGVSTLKLSWNKVNDASYYYVYRLNSTTDKYEKIGTTSSNTYTDKDLKSATNYYYKVKPYANISGEFTNRLKATTKPLTPKVSLKSDSYTRFTATWTNTSTRNSGYEVYMSTSKDKNYNLLGNTSEKSFTAKELEKNKTYYVKVRAYRTVDGEKIYGSYSSVTSVTLEGPKTTVSGLLTSLSKTAGLSLVDTIEITPAYGRKVYLQRYDSKKGSWVTKVTYNAPNSSTGSVKLVYPSEWYNQISSKWRVYIPAIDKGNKYTSPTINIKAKRVYENPNGYIKLKEKITVTGGGKDLVRGTMGLKVAKVQRRLGMGHVWEIVGPTTISRVMAFQRANGLKATGVVNLATWKKLGFSESSWYTLDTYVTPVKTKLTDTREDLIERMISTAKSYLGTEYVVGAAGVPGSGIDCSGLVMQSMYSVGIDPAPISVTRHTQPGYEYESRNLWKLPTLKTVSKPKRGDLVFYKNSAGVIIHVAIYLGNDRVVESWPQKVVEWPLIHPERPLIKGYKRIFG